MQLGPSKTLTACSHRRWEKSARYQIHSLKIDLLYRTFGRMLPGRKFRYRKKGKTSVRRRRSTKSRFRSPRLAGS